MNDAGDLAHRATFAEDAAEIRYAGLPFSHVSIEAGHFYIGELLHDGIDLVRHFERVRPWIEAIELQARAMTTTALRASVCVLIDDYFGAEHTPSQVVPQLIDAARTAGVELDYVARESGCASVGQTPVAASLLSRICEDPAPNSSGSRPPVSESGWLPNGRRSSHPDADTAMSGSTVWTPPSENSAKNHSIFLDVELWDDNGSERRWSCPFLAAAWQLIRLGLLRHEGQPVHVPEALDLGSLGESWSEMPAVVSISDDADPFHAYRTWSVLDSRFLQVEHAVRSILSQLYLEDQLLALAPARARREGIPLGSPPVDRIGYVFIPQSGDEP